MHRMWVWAWAWLWAVMVMWVVAETEADRQTREDGPQPRPTQEDGPQPRLTQEDGPQPRLVLPSDARLLKIVFPNGVPPEIQMKLISYLASLSETPGPNMITFRTESQSEYHVVNLPAARVSSG